MKHVRVMSRVPHDLFRHATDIDAGAAQGAAFDDRGARAVFRRTLRVGESAAAASDDDKVVFRTQFQSPDFVYAASGPLAAEDGCGTIQRQKKDLLSP